MLHDIIGISILIRILIMTVFSLIWVVLAWLVLDFLMGRLKSSRPRFIHLFVSLFFLLCEFISFNILFLADLTFPPMGRPYLFFGTSLILFAAGVILILCQKPTFDDWDDFSKPDGNRKEPDLFSDQVDPSFDADTIF